MSNFSIDETEKLGVGRTVYILSVIANEVKQSRIKKQDFKLQNRIFFINTKKYY